MIITKLDSKIVDGKEKDVTTSSGRTHYQEEEEQGDMCLQGHRTLFLILLNFILFALVL